MDRTEASLAGRNCILYDSGADGVCLDGVCFCLACVAIGNSVFCFRSGFPQDLVDTVPGICQPVEVPGGIGRAGGWQFDCLNASLFTAEAVVHFSRQPAVCVNRLDGSVIQNRGEVVGITSRMELSLDPSMEQLWMVSQTAMWFRSRNAFFSSTEDGISSFRRRAKSFQKRFCGWP